jgi:hypothetical protein
MASGTPWVQYQVKAGHNVHCRTTGPLGPIKQDWLVEFGKYKERIVLQCVFFTAEYYFYNLICRHISSLKGAKRDDYKKSYCLQQGKFIFCDNIDTIALLNEAITLGIYINK